MGLDVTMDPALTAHTAPADLMNYANQSAALLQGASQLGNSVISGYNNQAINNLNHNAGLARNDINQGYTQARAGNQSYVNAGQDSLAAYMSSLGIGSGSGGPTGSGISSYYNSPSFLLTNNPATAGQTPLERFQAGPGYQFQLDQATRLANSQMAKAGLGQSGALGNALVDRATGLANTEYNNWQQNQQQQFDNYQSNLNNLVGVGQNASNWQNQSYINQGTANSGIQSTLGQQIAGILSGQGQQISQNLINSQLASNNYVLDAANQGNKFSLDMVTSIMNAIAASQ